MGDMGNRVRGVVSRLTALALVAAVTIGCSVPTLSARRGGVFVVALDSPVLTLDPALVTELSSARVVKQMCETLVSYDAETGTFQPRLAVSWAVSGDGRVWTFTLRSGVIFHDGTPLTSDAVVQNITRWFDPASPFHRGDFDYWQMIFGGFRGSGSIVRSVERVDDYRVRLTLEQPYSPLLAAFSLFPFSIVSPTAMASDVDALRRRPVCTGPFRFGEWASDGAVALTANEAYWGGRAKLDAVRFVAMGSEAERMAALRNGTVHLVEGSMDSARLARQMSGVKVFLRPSRSVVFLSINQKAAPFDDARVRQAVAQAIDRKAIADKLYGGLAQPADQFVPPGIAGYDRTLAGISYNRSTARQLLTDAGYGGGLLSQLWHPTRARSLMPDPRALAETIAGDLRGIDIVTVVNSLDAVTYQQRSLEGALPLYLQTWTGDIPDADSFLTNLFASDAVSRSIGYSSPEIKTTLAAARSESNASQRVTLYQQAAAMLRSDMPRVPLVYVQSPVLVQRQVSGFTPGPFGLESYQTVSLGR